MYIIGTIKESTIHILSMVVICLSLVIGGGSAHGQGVGENDKLQALWLEYAAVESISSDPKLSREWATKLHEASALSSLNWDKRAAFIREAAALYGAAGDRDLADAAYEQLYEGAVKANDAEHQWISLNHMINMSSRPTTLDDLQKATDLYDRLQAVLSNPPLGNSKAGQQALADTYYEFGRMLERTADRIEDLADYERQNLYNRSIGKYETFNQLRMFENESEGSSLLQLGKAYAKAERTSDAVATFKKVASLPSSESNVAPMYAMFLSIELEYPQRQDRILPMERVLAKFPVDKWTNAFKQGLVSEYIAAEKWDKAIALLRVLQGTGESDKVNAYRMYMLGTTLRRAGQLDDASAVLSELQKRYPETDIAKYLASEKDRMAEMHKEDIFNELDHMMDGSVDRLTSMKVTDTAKTTRIEPSESTASVAGASVDVSHSATVPESDKPSIPMWQIILGGFLVIAAISGGLSVWLKRARV